MYLLDTNIVSADALAKHAIGPGAFAAWIRRNGDRLFISTITIAEIEAGIARAARVGAATKGERLRHCLPAVEHFYAGRILAFGIEEAWHAGTIIDRARRTIPDSRISPSPRRPRCAASPFLPPTSAALRRSACRSPIR